MSDALHNKVVKFFYDHEELFIAIMNKTPYQSDGWDYEIEVVKEFLTANQSCYCGDIYNLGVIHRDDGPCHYPNDKEPEQGLNKDGSPCPEFWDWLPKAYNFEGDGNFTKYNMEVAFLAGKQALAQPEQCNHQWVSAKNEVVQNGSVCVKCMAISPKEPAELTQPEQEPVAWMREGWGPDCGPYIEFYRDDEMGSWRDKKEWTPLFSHPPVPTAQPDQDEVDIRSRLYQRIHELESQLVQFKEPEQEPVATVAEVYMSRYTIELTNGPLPEGTNLYTTSPQRKPLTDEEIANAANLVQWSQQYHIDFARAIEAAHGIKENT